MSRASAAIAWSEHTDEQLDSLARCYRWLAETTPNAVSRAIYTLWLSEVTSEIEGRTARRQFGGKRDERLFGRDFLDDLRQRADIVAEFDFVFPVAQIGKDRRECPVCLYNGHRGEVSLSREKGLFQCFRCHFAGDVFTIWQNLGFLALDFPDAVRNVAARVGVPLPQAPGPPAQDRFLRAIRAGRAHD